MKLKSRTALSAVNILSGFANRLITSVLKLITRIVFFRFLSLELYGVSGLFSNVLGLLALAELGIGSAITFSLYTPLAEKNEEKIASLMHFYKKAYRLIALTVFLLGIGLMPLLPKLIRNYQGIDFFYWIYLIFLCNSVIEYLFSYKRTLATAAQEAYRLVPYTTFFEVLSCILQIGIILLFHRNPYCFLFYLGINTLCILFQNLFINRFLDRNYPVLLQTKAAPLPPEEKRTIGINVRALMFHKIGSVVVAGTDNLLISRLVDLVTVGLYSNYSTLISTVSGIVYLFVGNTTASFGNLIAKEPPQKRLDVFRELQFFYFALYGMASVFFLTLFAPFISFAYGEDFHLPFPVVLLIIFANFYLLGMTYVMDVIKSAAGLYDQDKWVPLVQGGLNLFFSIWGGIRFGLAGIFLGTLISTLVPLAVKPVIVYHNVFKKSATEYFISLLYELAVLALMGASSFFLCSLVNTDHPLLCLILSFFITALTSGGIFLLMHLRSPYLPALFARVKSLVSKNR